ncbi:MAG: hypothetical protein HYY10_02030 [Candidatus Liptonbacteria bacterium]|nr:hypothetical protein [Candidatus Liptonbacteria bacterium]
MNTPSIGSVGLTVDAGNKRVKVLRTEVFTSIEEAKAALIEGVAGSCDAKRLLSGKTARFTARVIGSNLGTITPFPLPGGIAVQEEARIRTASGLDVVYVGGNARERLNAQGLAEEQQLSAEATRWHPQSAAAFTHPEEATFERLTSSVSDADVAELVAMYHLCFTSYLVPLDEALVRGAAANSIFFVARNGDGRIIASAIGESLRVGPLTLLEVSEEAAHPKLRIRGAASGCARMVIAEGRQSLEPPVVAFWEARMWRNILGMGQAVGLTKLGGVLHQHCTIASPPEFTSLSNKGEFGSLAVFYAP